MVYKGCTCKYNIIMVSRTLPSTSYYNGFTHPPVDEF